jgi:hypothetical protein
MRLSRHLVHTGIFVDPGDKMGRRGVYGIKKDYSARDCVYFLIYAFGTVREHAVQVLVSSANSKLEIGIVFFQVFPY